MTKNERIAQLEDKVRLLDRQLDDVCVAYDDLRAAVDKRLDALEARPIVPWDSDPGLTDSSTWTPENGWSVGCDAQRLLRVVPFSRPSWSWDGSTLDANGHIQ